MLQRAEQIKKGQWNRRIQKFANNLNKRLPASEKWFWSEWNKLGMKFGDEVRNAPFMGTIPDVRSKKFKYIIEVDGDSHNDPDVRLKDVRKSNMWHRAGYKVFRIKAYKIDELRSVAGKVQVIRSKEPLSDVLRRIYEL
jgi:very-short-patch-repair endonuclease